MTNKKEDAFITELMAEIKEKSSSEALERKQASNKELTRDDLALLLEQNLALTEEIYRLTKKVHNYITFSKIMGLVQLIFIFAPLILAAIYLPPMLKNVFSEYQSLLGPVKF